jgi:hypothetical protein
LLLGDETQDFPRAIYIGGFESFREWVKKLGNFFKVETVSPQDVAPFKRAIANVVSIGQEKMPDCRGIKRMGFKPHLVYNPEAWSQARLPPRVECQEDLDVDSTKSVNSSTESWDHAEDSNELYL